MSALSFSFAQISQALALRHDVAPARLPAFQARLKHYQKQGYPEGINTGRGKAAIYNIGHAIKLELALELNQMGLIPERAIQIVRFNTYRWSVALRLTMSSRVDGDEYPTFIYFDPSALDDLRADGAEDLADATFHYAGMGQLHESLTQWANAVPRLALINIPNMAAGLAAGLSKHSGHSEKSLLLAIKAWADEDHDDGDD